MACQSIALGTTTCNECSLYSLRSIPHLNSPLLSSPLLSSPLFATPLHSSPPPLLSSPLLSTPVHSAHLRPLHSLTFTQFHSASLAASRRFHVHVPGVPGEHLHQLHAEDARPQLLPDVDERRAHGKALPGIARHVIGCHLTQYTRARNPLDDLLVNNFAVQVGAQRAVNAQQSSIIGMWAFIAIYGESTVN